MNFRRHVNALLMVCSLTGFCAESWQEGNGFRFKPLSIPPGGKPGFELLLPTQTGVSFTNMLPESRALTNTILPNGSGVAAGDFDGDGWCDLFFCGLAGGSKLYRNLGSWRFQDVTDAAGVKCPGLDISGTLFADIDGDGDLDLLVNTYGTGTLIFLNDGRGHFSSVAQHLNPARGGTSLAAADSDGDGRLDLYIANYRASTILDAPGTRFNMKMVNNHPEIVSINGRPLTDPEWTNRFKLKTEMDELGRGRFMREELGEPDVFYKNLGNGRFVPISWTDGRFLDEDGKPLASSPLDWGLSVAFRDFDGDGAPDIYVCNDFGSPDRFWLNDGHGHFRAAPRSTLREISFSSMGIDVADLDRDGHFDFMVVEMLSRDHQRRLTQRNSMHSKALSTSADRPQYPRNTLFVNRADGTYAEIAQYAGVDASEWSWMPVFLDVDLDGYEDLLVPNGFIRDNMNMDVQNRIKELNAGKKVLSVEALSLRKLFPPLATPNLAFRNLGAFRFSDLSHEWGFDTAAISQGACLADLDNDGDLDVIVNNMNGPAGLYRNQSPAPRVAVRLRGQAGNTHGIGALIKVAGGPVSQSQEITCGGRYLSCDETLRVFAAWGLTNRLRIDVAWRSGKRSTVPEAQPNCIYEIDEAAALMAPFITPAPKVPSPIFEDVSNGFLHEHSAETFDDFQRQPLLPRSLSQLGPGICWWDVDGDGWEDLVIGSGKGGRLACFRNDGKGGFSRLNQAPWNAVANRGQTAVVGWGASGVLVGSANYEDGLTNGSAVRLYDSAQGKPQEMVFSWDSTPGPLAVADYDEDGALDLFVGGRVKPGQYPVAATSRLYRQREGKLELDAANSSLLREIGLVSGALWTDLDGDGWPELVLACEWGPIRIFKNDHGKLSATDFPVSFSGSSTLHDLTGWWNGVGIGDFDGDGRPDIVASNWGQNTKYERFRTKPLRLYYADLNSDGVMQLLEACFEPSRRQYVPSRMLDAVTQAVPFLTARFPTHQAWAAAALDDVLGEARGEARYCEAACLESMLFLNRGDHFEARALPFEAQLAPAFAVCVADFDGDGNQDLFLSQNFFSVDNETSRYDAGRGLWLRGDGQGGLRAVPGQESGVSVYGEQRGAAIADFDHDGRIDLVVAQNAGQTRLYHNLTGKPGLRVRLRGSSANPYGIGATVRLKFGDRFGPAQEIHGGSGYWSQDSTVMVFGLPTEPTQAWVRWPGGKTTLIPIPAGSREIQISYPP